MRKSLRTACRKVEERFRYDGITVNLSRVRSHDFHRSYAMVLRAKTRVRLLTERLMLYQSASTTETVRPRRRGPRIDDRARAVHRSRRNRGPIDMHA